MGAAGILVELAIAAWATLAWTLLPDGPLRGSMLLVATTTWVSTLLVNASPFMRFDGYFLLSDMIGVPNLHERSFALAKQLLRKALFGYEDPDPEPGLGQKTKRAMMIFAVATWTYRLVLFLGIAVVVYNLFFKHLGIFRFAV